MKIEVNYSSIALSPKQKGGDDIVHTKILDDGSLLAILADGATGAGDGRMAADLFVQSCINNIRLFNVSDDVITEAFAKADEQIQSTGLYADTTGIVMLIKDGEYKCASVGDSECWMSSPDGRIAITINQRRKPRIGSGSYLPFVNKGRVDGCIVLGSDGLFMAFPSVDEIFSIAVGAVNDKAGAVALAAEARNTILPDDLSIIIVS